MNEWYLRDHACTGLVAAMIIHSTDDDTVDYASATTVRDELLRINGCSTDTVTTDHPPCELHEGCDVDFPVEMCTFDDAGHSDFDWDSLGATIWEFFASFQPSGRPRCTRRSVRLHSATIWSKQGRRDCWITTIA